MTDDCRSIITKQEYHQVQFVSPATAVSSGVVFKCNSRVFVGLGRKKTYWSVPSPSQNLIKSAYIIFQVASRTRVYNRKSCLKVSRILQMELLKQAANSKRRIKIRNYVFHLCLPRGFVRVLFTSRLSSPINKSKTCNLVY